MTKKESEILADAYESVRNLTKFYFSQLNPEDIDISLSINGVKFNSPYWIAAHLVWTENFLLLKGLGGESSDIEWLEEYGFGSNPEDIKTKPHFEEVMKSLDEVHEEAMKHVRSLTDSQLEEKNNIDANFGGKDTKRVVLIHAIRHEPMHVGQLSWFLKARGTKTV